MLQREVRGTFRRAHELTATATESTKIPMFRIVRSNTDLAHENTHRRCVVAIARAEQDIERLEVFFI